VKDILGILKKAVWDWMEDQAPTLGAALAYYTVFSLAPLLVISISIAGLVFGQEAAQGQIFDQLRSLIGAASAEAVQDVVQNANAKSATGVTATIVGFIALLFGASGVFGQLQASLNAIWGVEPKPGRGLWGIIQDRILSFGFILVVGFLLLVSLILTAAIAFVGEWFGGVFPAIETLVQIGNSILSLMVITLLFAMIFKFMPDAKIAWRDVWIGAFTTAALFTVGKLVLGSVPRKKRYWLVVWGGGLAHCTPAMGVLFVADRLFRSGGHAGVRESIRLANCSR
jgi:membrane protein